VAGGSRTADGPVQGEQRAGHDEGAAVLVRDAAALAGSARGAVTADGLVAQERAVVDAGGRGHGHGRGGYPGNEVCDPAALGDLWSAAGAGGPTHRPVVHQRAVTDGEDRVAEESDVRDGPARRDGTGEAAAEAPDGPIVQAHAVADGKRAVVVHDGAAEGAAGEGSAGAGRAADDL